MLNERSKFKIYEVCLVIIGTFMVALAVEMFIIPYNILSGGVAGIAVAISPLIHIDETLIANVLVVGLLFAAWKAPAWVKEIGTITLVIGLMSPLIPLYQFLSTLQDVAAEQSATVSSIFDLIPPGVLFGVKALLIPVIYGMIVYVVSLVIRIIRTPRL